MGIVYAALIITAIAVGAVWLWLCYKLYRWVSPKKPKLENPYVKAHLIKLHNDKMYDEYQDWMAKHGSGVPIPKVTTPEDVEAEKKIKRLF